jgi:phosphonate transport system substrate-binding protein
MPALSWLGADGVWARSIEGRTRMWMGGGNIGRATRSAHRALVPTALVLMLALYSLTAAALDARYVDNNGDLVADAPARTINPTTLLFAYTPGEDPALYGNAWTGFLRYLEKTIGRRIRFYAAQSNTAQIEAMRAGRLHIAAFGTGAVPIAVNCAGFAPFAIMGGDRGILGYEMEIITHPGSGIKTLADLKGRRLAFTSPTSNSGFKMPSVLLQSEFGLEANRDYSVVFAGRHENSVLGVAHRDYDAAAIANEVMHRMMARKVVQKDQIVTVYKSSTFPTAAFGLAYNLDPQLARSIHDAFFSFPWAGSGLAKEFATLGVSKFMPITYRNDWAVVRKVDAALKVKYDCR